jgi:starch-binding outer membrane protein, SusD/RagB family
VATDEATWLLSGSRNAWGELDRGFITNPNNEFTDAAFRFVAQARWMADQAVTRVEAFESAGTLTDRLQLARAYLYGAIIYVAIGEIFQDFVLSDRREASPPIGRANMGQMFDTAIQYTDRGLAVATALNNNALRTQLLSVRARAKHAKAVRARLGTGGQAPANPLVADAGATADAAAALALMTGDYRQILRLANDDLARPDGSEVPLAYNINQRDELEIEPVYGRVRPTVAVNLNDPITGQPDPVVLATLTAFKGAGINMPITITSAREMRLILAEAALAQDNTAEFTAQINAIRALDNLPAWSDQVPALDIFKHTRRVNLLLQGRRLMDMYRFGERSSLWQPTATTITQPGTLLPITCIEIRAHPQNFPGAGC